MSKPTAKEIELSQQIMDMDKQMNELRRDVEFWKSKWQDSWALQSELADSLAVADSTIVELREQIHERNETISHLQSIVERATKFEAPSTTAKRMSRKKSVAN